jgi:hypothetical protein
MVCKVGNGVDSRGSRYLNENCRMRFSGGCEGKNYFYTPSILPIPRLCNIADLESDHSIVVLNYPALSISQYPFEDQSSREKLEYESRDTDSHCEVERIRKFTCGSTVTSLLVIY